MPRTKGGGDSSFKCTGTTPHAPWTEIWIRNAPIPSSSGVVEKAQSGMIGSARSAAMMIARLRPIRSDQMPNAMPPVIAPTFMTIAIVPVRRVSK